MGAEILLPTGVRCPDRPAHSQSQYRSTYMKSKMFVYDTVSAMLQFDTYNLQSITTTYFRVGTLMTHERHIHLILKVSVLNETYALRNFT